MNATPAIGHADLSSSFMASALLTSSNSLFEKTEKIDKDIIQDVSHQNDFCEPLTIVPAKTTRKRKQIADSTVQKKMKFDFKDQIWSVPDVLYNQYVVLSPSAMTPPQDDIAVQSPDINLKFVDALVDSTENMSSEELKMLKEFTTLEDDKDQSPDMALLTSKIFFIEKLKVNIILSCIWASMHIHLTQRCQCSLNQSKPTSNIDLILLDLECFLCHFFKSQRNCNLALPLP